MNDIRSLFTPTTPENARDTPLKEDEDAPDIKGINFDKPTVVAFLRHIGCPFAEKSLELRKFAEKHGDGYQYLAIINGSESNTEDYIREIGGTGKLHVIPDPDPEVYGRWGVGLAGWGHVLGWRTLSSVWSLARGEGIKNRVTRGNRWVSSATFGVRWGKVVWGQMPSYAGDIPDFEEVRKALDGRSSRESKL